MRDYFARQIAWLEQEHSEFAEIEEQFGRPVESLDPSRFRHAEDIAASERECRQLAEEWAAAADVTAEERAFVAALAVRAEQLALELRRAHDRAQRAVQERLDELRENWDALQRGRSMLGKYRVRRDDEGGLIDKQA